MAKKEHKITKITQMKKTKGNEITDKISPMRISAKFKKKRNLKLETSFY